MNKEQKSQIIEEISQDLAHPSETRHGAVREGLFRVV